MIETRKKTGPKGKYDPENVLKTTTTNVPLGPLQRWTEKPLSRVSKALCTETAPRAQQGSLTLTAQGQCFWGESYMPENACDMV